MLFLYFIILFFPFGFGITLAIDNQDYWPTLEWRTSSPEEQGMNSRKLDKMDDYIESNNWFYYVSKPIRRELGKEHRSW